VTVVVMLLCFVLLFLAILTRMASAPLVASWRNAWLSASVIWSIYLTLITETLSALHQLTADMALACWMALALALDAYLFWRLRRGGLLWKRMGFVSQPAARWIVLGGIIAIVCVALIAALAAPPNTPDTFTYHLPRVMHWIQNASLDPYPTNYISQDIQPPWDEYVLLHLHLLFGGDALDGAVQWFCFVGCAIGVSLIAQQLGAGLQGQLFAAVFTVTIPMAVVQASSTQNDLVCAFWLVTLVYFMLAYAQSPALLHILGVGASLGLAVLTKGVAYVDALPFLLLLSIWIARSRGWRSWQLFSLIASIALGINLGFFLRNVAAFGNPLGPVATTRLYSNAAYAPDVLLLNVLRNLAVELGGPIQSINSTLTTIVYHTVELLHLNPNDPRATMTGSPTFMVRGSSGLWLSDGYADNPLHLLLALLASVCCITIGSLRRERLVMSYLAALTGAFMLFSLYLRWQAGSNRLMLSLFVLAAPLVGVTAEFLCQRGTRITPRVTPKLMLIAQVLLLLASLPWAFFSQSRPLLGASSVLSVPRVDQYFAAYPQAEPTYLGAVDYTARYMASHSCTELGYYVSGTQDSAGYSNGAPSWEYPLWVFLNGHGGRQVRIEHVSVTNATAPLARTPRFASFQPCAVFAIVETRLLLDTLSSNGVVFTRVWTRPAFYDAVIAVFVRNISAIGIPDVHDRNPILILSGSR
jgi:4-amino-4-deoxy-L-arabinose transferase-like glycosyltransferase